MDKTILYNYKNHSYQVNITYKRIRSITYRFRDNVFIVSCPYLTSNKLIEKGLDKFAGKFIENQSFNDDYFYLYGTRYELSNSGEMTFDNGIKIKYQSKEDLLIKLKPLFLKAVTDRVRYYEKIMNLPSYKVKIRDMSSRYGSNSRQTKTLSFSLMLIHFSIDIIDSVIIHELSHCLVFNHSKKFYDVVYTYCPNYNELHKKLRKKIYR